VRSGRFALDVYLPLAKGADGRVSYHVGAHYSDLVTFLLDPRSYPDSPSGIVHHETHISHVFVGDAYVYKIKKPVNFGFLDFSTLEKRHFYCREEVVLNSRLAGDVYLGVVPIYGRDGRYSFRRSKGAGIVEYAVKMRTIPEERLFSSLIGAGRLLEDEAAEVGAMVARFHRQAPAHRAGPYGGLSTVRTNAEENFEQIGAYRGATVDADLYDRLVEKTHAFLRDHEALFGQRKTGGFVREGHGDLHTQHVCLIRPPVIVDCIEFNKRFRISDVLEDIAFLLMDLEDKGRHDLSLAVSRAYFTRFPSACSVELLQFYKTYRAVVRGKIEGFTAKALAEEDPGAAGAAKRRAADYFSLAGYYMGQAHSLFNPVVLMGPAGSGKSAAAKGLLGDALVLRSDEVRKRIAGLKAADHVYVDYGTGLYNAETTHRTYRALTEGAVAACREGRRVVVDAVFLASDLVRQFYDASIREGLNPFFISCFADHGVLRERVRRRVEDGSDVSDAHPEVLERQLAVMEAPKDIPSFRLMRIDTGRASPEEIRQALRLFLAPGSVRGGRDGREGAC